MSWLGPFYLYAHENTDEDYSGYVEELEDIGMEADDAKKFITGNPLYEVEFEFFINPETGHYKCTGAHLGGGIDLVAPLEVVERSYR